MAASAATSYRLVSVNTVMALVREAIVLALASRVSDLATAAWMSAAHITRHDGASHQFNRKFVPHQEVADQRALAIRLQTILQEL